MPALRFGRGQPPYVGCCTLSAGVPLKARHAPRALKPGHETGADGYRRRGHRRAGHRTSPQQEKALPEAVAEYLATKQAAHDRTLLSGRQLRSIQNELTTFQRRFPKEFLSAFTPAKLVPYLERGNPSLKTYNNRRGLLSTLFKFGLQKDWVAKNPIEKTPHHRINHRRGSAETIVAKYRSMGEAALQAGNSESIIRKHYLDLKSKEEAEQFFAIIPKRITRPQAEPVVSPTSRHVPGSSGGFALPVYGCGVRAPRPHSRPSEILSPSSLLLSPARRPRPASRLRAAGRGRLLSASWPKHLKRPGAAASPRVPPN